MGTRATPHYGHAPADMRRRADTAKFERIGDFCWSIFNGQRLLWIAVPDQDGDDGWSAISVTVGNKNRVGAKWEWDGNEDKPTLTPSIHVVGTWHGFVRGGQLIEA